MTSPGAGVRLAGAVGVRWDWVLLLPPGWVRLPTAAAEGRRAVTALLDRRLRHLPRDQIAAGRRGMEAELRQDLADAREAGASEVYTQVDLIRGMPVSAGLLVARLRVGGEDNALLSALSGVLGASGDVVECATTFVGDLPALRRRRHLQRPLAPGTPPRPHTAVDWVVSLPDSDDVLVLAFATSTQEVADALVALFDAIAQSLEIAPHDPDSPVSKEIQ